jgi:hypothetical protein
VISVKYEEGLKSRADLTRWPENRPPLSEFTPSPAAATSVSPPCTRLGIQVALPLSQARRRWFKEDYNGTGSTNPDPQLFV